MKKEEIEFNEFKINTLLIHYGKTNKNLNINEIEWEIKAFNFLLILKKIFENLSDFQKKQDLFNYLHLDSLILLASKKEHAYIRDYLNSIYSFKPQNQNQNALSYEKHGYVIMQFSAMISNWNDFYINKELDYQKFLEIGFNDFFNDYLNSDINKHKKAYFFKNGIIDFHSSSICFNMDDGYYKEFYLKNSTVIEEIKKIETYKPSKDKDNLSTKYFYSEFPKYVESFDSLSNIFELNFVNNLFINKDSLLYSIESLDDLIEILAINYKI